eukprot:scaffold32300_cov69-Phaeocystis_antarctica.AAC.4
MKFMCSALLRVSKYEQCGQRTMVSVDSLSAARACASETWRKRGRCSALRCASKEASVTGSEHMLHAGGKASALSSFSLEEQKEIEQSPQRWCGGSEAQRTPLCSWESASEHTQHSTDIAVRSTGSLPRAERKLKMFGEF